MTSKTTTNHSNNNIGVPLKLLYEAEGMKITVELKNGEIYRGLLVAAEGETMNVSLTDVLRTRANGHVQKLPTSTCLYLKGTSIRFLALPELLKQSPLIQTVATQKRKLEQALAEQMGESSNNKGQRQHRNKKRKVE
ncbi:hypothetical protein ACA910_020791 [Epithemia clementina (nom. ined.)]